MRDEDIERRLVEWATWRDRRAGGRMGGGLGVAAAGFEVRASGGYHQVAIPVIDWEAQITDEAVLALPSVLRAAVEAYYLRQGGVSEAARRLVIGESTLRKRIGQAHQALRVWLADRAGRRREQLERDQASRRMLG